MGVEERLLKRLEKGLGPRVRVRGVLDTYSHQRRRTGHESGLADVGFLMRNNTKMGVGEFYGET